MRYFLSISLLIGLLTGCGTSDTQDQTSVQGKKETKVVENTEPQVMEQTEEGKEQPEVTEIPEENVAEQQAKTPMEQDGQKKVQQKSQVVQEEQANSKEVPEVVEEKPDKVEQNGETVDEEQKLEEQVPVQPAPSNEEPKPAEPQEPPPPLKTPEQLFIEYVDSGNWTLSTNTRNFNRRQVYIYGVEAAEENFVGNYVKKYIEQNISGGNPVNVSVYVVDYGVKTYKFTW